MCCLPDITIISTSHKKKAVIEKFNMKTYLKPI